VESGATFVGAGGLNFTAPNTTGSGVTLDGNLAANQTAVNAIVAGLSWAPGQTLALRWTDVDDGGSDDGLGIDNLSFAGAFVKNLIWNPVSNRNWNTTDANWLNSGNPDTFVTN